MAASTQRLRIELRAVAWISASLLACAATSALAQQAHSSWREYGGGPDNSKFSSLSQITKDNVTRLELAFHYPTGENGSYEWNPIVVDGVMYVLGRNSSLVALDAATGREIWIHENLRGIATRGINYWESPDGEDRRLIFQMNHFLQEIDARTGHSILSFGNRGLVDLKEGLGRDPSTIVRVQSTTPGRVFENLIILGSAPGENYMAAPGDVRAYDVITGELVWTFHTVPRPGEFGYDTWPKDAWKYIGGVNAWGEISLDAERGIAYVPLGSPTYDYYGADRAGANLFGNSLVALDARTGERLWHFQTVHHDLWDYDLAAAPQLVTVRRDGRTIDAVAQATKQGFLFVFDRVTGAPLWPIEERPVPPSNAPGEAAWPTQPFPNAPPPFTRQVMTAQDVNPFLLTNEERTEWTRRLQNARSGLYLPPSTEYEIIAMPGARGGANWGTTASHPDAGLVYILAQEWPTYYRLSLTPPLSGVVPANAAASDADQLHEQRCSLCHGARSAGSGAAAPSLDGISLRMDFDAFRQIVLTGKGKMPAFADLSDAALDDLFAFLSNARSGAPPPAPPAPQGGPVVASGGAPGGLVVPRINMPSFAAVQGPPYPADVEVQRTRYYTDWGMGFPWSISPPWSTLVAYDLNEGVIKWKVPFGEDLQAAAEGFRGGGIPRGAERHGAVVTATGLIFAAASDGKVRAYDADNGDVLWTATLPWGSEGIPAMYEIDGRQFLAVPASTSVPITRPTPGGPTSIAGTQRGYAVYALPIE